MGKSIFNKLFGMGKLPKKIVPILEKEGIVLLDEGISGSVTLRKFKAPGRRHSYKKSGFVGSIVITKVRFAAFSFSRPVINVALNYEHLSLLDLSIIRNNVLCVKFDASDFHDESSGSVECRFSTTNAGKFMDWLKLTKS